MADRTKGLGKRLRKHDHILVLMRHCKTEGSNPEGDLHRVLTDKGLKQATRMAKGLEGLDLVPQRIACSAAERARQTMDRMLTVFGDGPQVLCHMSLYEDGMQAVWDQLGQVPNKTKRFMVIGHEPTVSLVSGWIASKDSDPSLMALLHVGVPTGSVVVFGGDKPFDKWGPHDAELLTVLTPDDFKD